MSVPSLRLPALAGLVLAAAVATPADSETPGRAALPLHAERASPFDLAVRGRFEAASTESERFLRWADLRRLPTQSLVLTGEFVKGEQTVTALALHDLWAALPVDPGADVVLASCTDGYASVFTRAFVSKHLPFLVLEIDGKGPEHWPPPGLKFNPGPYVITVSSQLSPGVATVLDVDHKRPWGVNVIEFARFDARFAPVLTGRWGNLSVRAREGREIWINSCTSCHTGPDALFGGSKSARPFEVVAAHAGFNQAYFRTYIRDPKALNPAATMQPHPHYTDAQIDALIAFIVAEPASAP
jgi:hypothetical protein